MAIANMTNVLQEVTLISIFKTKNNSNVQRVKHDAIKGSPSIWEKSNSDSVTHVYQRSQEL